MEGVESKFRELEQVIAAHKRVGGNFHEEVRTLNESLARLRGQLRDALKNSDQEKAGGLEDEIATLRAQLARAEERMAAWGAGDSGDQLPEEALALARELFDMAAESNRKTREDLEELQQELGRLKAEYLARVSGFGDRVRSAYRAAELAVRGLKMTRQSKDVGAVFLKGIPRLSVFFVDEDDVGRAAGRMPAFPLLRNLLE